MFSQSMERLKTEKHVNQIKPMWWNIDANNTIQCYILDNTRTIQKYIQILNLLFLNVQIYHFDKIWLISLKFDDIYCSVGCSKPWENIFKH